MPAAGSISLAGNTAQRTSYHYGSKTSCTIFYLCMQCLVHSNIHRWADLWIWYWCHRRSDCKWSFLSCLCICIARFVSCTCCPRLTLHHTLLIINRNFNLSSFLICLDLTRTVNTVNSMIRYVIFCCLSVSFFFRLSLPRALSLSFWFTHARTV